MSRSEAMDALASALGVLTSYTDGLGKPVQVSEETLVKVCEALGAEIATPEDAPHALAAYQLAHARELLPPTVVAWEGHLDPIPLGPSVPEYSPGHAELHLEGDGFMTLEVRDGHVRCDEPIPFGYHTLRLEIAGREGMCTVIAAPEVAWSRPGSRSWGVGTHLAALRSKRSRSVADLRDLEQTCRWVGHHGGDLVTVLPLLPTFNDTADPEPSPYSPVSRLFWSELVLDLGRAHKPVGAVTSLNVTRADAEVRAALAGIAPPDSASLDAELLRYARFRGAQARLGRNWRDWPAAAREGRLSDEHVDPEEERFHLVAQKAIRHQLDDLLWRLDPLDVRLGLDLAVGVHPDGFDPWSRQSLFGKRMSVGAPPDPGFPSGQDWGFSPVLPDASRREGHRYLAASIAHQAKLAEVLRIDHVMAFTRLYWIPHGFGLHQGTYVRYPAEELFAVLTLESHRNQCEVVGENLGTVPPEIDEALKRHKISGMYLAQFSAASPEPTPPPARDMALIGTHDTPTFQGWLDHVDIAERVRTGLLDAEAAPDEKETRTEAAQRLAEALEGSVDHPRALLKRLLDWMGSSPSPLVVPWIEDLWLEAEQVNLPGTRSSERPNWQRPMTRLLEDVFADADVEELVRTLQDARRRPPVVAAGATSGVTPDAGPQP